MEAAGAMEGTESQDVCPHAPGEGEELKTDKITRMFLRLNRLRHGLTP